MGEALPQTRAVLGAQLRSYAEGKKNQFRNAPVCTCASTLILQHVSWNEHKCTISSIKV